MVKRAIRVVSPILLVALITGCFLWNPDVHNIRVVSTVTDGVIENLSIGGISFGDVETDTPTGYKEIERKTEHTITMGAGSTVIGTVELHGLGTHNWTLTISGTLSEMTFALEED